MNILKKNFGRISQGTWLLLLTLLAFGTAYGVRHRSGVDFRELLVLPVLDAASKMDEIEVTLKGEPSFTLRLDSRVKQWVIAEPKNLSANRPAILELTRKLAGARLLERSPRVMSETAMGLDTPRAILRVRMGSLGGDFRLEIGGKSAEGEGCYARRAGAVVRMDTEDAALFLRPLDAYRDRRVFPYEPGAIQGIEINGKMALSLIGKISELGDGDIWAIRQPIACLAETGVVTAMTYGLSKLSAEQYYPWLPERAADFGFDQPSFQLRVLLRREDGSDHAMTLQFGNLVRGEGEGQNVRPLQFVRALSEEGERSDGPPSEVAAVPPDILSLFRLPLEKIRHKFIFAGNSAQLSKLEVTSRCPGSLPGSLRIVRNAKGEFVVEGRDYVPDKDFLEGYLSTILDLSARKFLADRASAEEIKKYGLDQPLLTLRLEWAAPLPIPNVVRIVQDKNGALLGLVEGTPAAPGDTIFLLKDQNKIFSRLAASAMNPQYFRDRQIFYGVSGVNLKNASFFRNGKEGKSELSLQILNQNGEWVPGGAAHKNLELNQDVIDGWTDFLANLKAEGFIPKTKEMKATALLVLSGEYPVYVQGGKPFEFRLCVGETREIDKDVWRTYFWFEGQDYVFFLSPADEDEFLNRPAEFLSIPRAPAAKSAEK